MFAHGESVAKCGDDWAVRATLERFCLDVDESDGVVYDSCQEVKCIWYSNEHNLKSGRGELAMSVGCYCLRPLIIIFTFSSVHDRRHQNLHTQKWYEVGWQGVGGVDQS